MAPLPAGDLTIVAQRLRTLGVGSNRDISAFLRRVKIVHAVARGSSLVSFIHPVRHLTILLDGLACMSVQHESGDRQIYAFHYPGDFLGLDNYVFPHRTGVVEVKALAPCAIGSIEYESVDQVLQSHPPLRLALWRAAMIEANVLRQRLATMRQPALQRVAHLLCEQLARRPTPAGVNEGVISLSQVQVADAVGLSVVHTNRIFQELRKLGVLSTRRQTIEVSDKRRLRELAVFDERYLDADEALSRWSVRFEP